MISKGEAIKLIEQMQNQVCEYSYSSGCPRYCSYQKDDEDSGCLFEMLSERIMFDLGWDK